MKKLSTSKQMNGNAAPKINPRRLLFLPTCIQAIASRGLNNLLRQILNRINLSFSDVHREYNGTSVDIATNRCIVHLAAQLSHLPDYAGCVVRA